MENNKKKLLGLLDFNYNETFEIEKHENLVCAELNLSDHSNSSCILHEFDCSSSNVSCTLSEADESFVSDVPALSTLTMMLILNLMILIIAFDKNLLLSPFVADGLELLSMSFLIYFVKRGLNFLKMPEHFYKLQGKLIYKNVQVHISIWVLKKV